MSSPITTISTKYNTIPSDLDSLALPNNPKIIGYDSKKFWAEFYLLCRVIYRSRNQHRASFSFQHLKEVCSIHLLFPSIKLNFFCLLQIKRVVERIGKLELWLKVNYTEKGKGLFDFIGFLNTLMLLIEKVSMISRHNELIFFRPWKLVQRHFTFIRIIWSRVFL